MTQRVADDVISKFARQQHDWFERVRKGSLDPEEVASAVQKIINSKRKVFFRDYFDNSNKWLKVDRSFGKLFFGKLDPMIPRRGVDGLTFCTLPYHASDQERIDKFRGNEDDIRKYSCTLDQIADKINLQRNGENGDLSTDGTANDFDVFPSWDDDHIIVYVAWASGPRRWYINAKLYSKDDNFRAAGTRVFFNTTITLWPEWSE